MLTPCQRWIILVTPQEPLALAHNKRMKFRSNPSRLLNEFSIAGLSISKEILSASKNESGDETCLT
jgi:hypothetical protein